jgi:hypothetical protein
LKYGVSQQERKIYSVRIVIPHDSAESWGIFIGYCVSQLIAVCLLYTEIKISALFEKMVRLLQN